MGALERSKGNFCRPCLLIFVAKARMLVGQVLNEEHGLFVGRGGRVSCGFDHPTPNTHADAGPSLELPRAINRTRRHATAEPSALTDRAHQKSVRSLSRSRDALTRRRHCRSFLSYLVNS